MKSCLWCHQAFTPQLTLAEVLRWQALAAPLLCANCQACFKRIDLQTACPSCGRAQSQATVCADCQQWQQQTTTFTSNQALFQYNTSMSEFFKCYKTQGDYRLRQLFKPALKRYFKRSQAILVPVPPDPLRYRQRGFDAVQGLFEGCGELVPCLSKSIGPKQAQRSRQARLQAPQPFFVQSAQLTKLTSRPIIILDDVYTTGRTLRHAYTCLQAAVPTAKIQTFTLAR